MRSMDGPQPCRTHYYGVSFHPRDRIYLARIKYQCRQVWLKTYLNPVAAACVHDCAARWLQGPDARLNFPGSTSLPPDVTEAHVANWLWRSSVPKSVLVRRIPARILREARISDEALLAGGMPIEDILKMTPPKTLA
jgi:hypothetical protein